MRPIVVVGSINADCTIAVERLPQRGETIAARDALLSVGGKGANQAAAAALLGHPTWLVGRIGDDAVAGHLRAALADRGVALDHLDTSPGASGQAVILLQPDGENSIIVVAGANARWPDAQPFDDATRARIAGAGALLLQREIPDAINVAAARIAHAHGVPVVLDVGGIDAPPPAELCDRVTVLSPNETELRRLTRVAAEDDASLIAAARAWRGARAIDVLIKLGARGCLLVPHGGEPMACPARRVAVVDTTGAGDCFTAAYAVALLDGMPVPERLRFATAAAALCVQRAGALASLPTHVEVAALLRNGRDG